MEIIIMSYLISVVLVIILIIKNEKIPGETYTIGDLMEHWVFIFLPIFNIFIVLILGIGMLIRLTKLGKLIKRLMKVKI